MGLNQEVWRKDVVGNLFPDNSFASQSEDDSEYVSNKTVHIPNAGTPPNVVKNRPFKQGGADVTTRTDNDLEYSIDEYTCDPVHVSNIEKTELTYSKRNSVMAGAKGKLNDTVYESLPFNWVPATPFKRATSGSAVAAHIPDATGNRKAFTVADVKAIQQIFNGQDIPQDGRNILLDSEMYGQLYDSMNDAQKASMQQTFDAKTGNIGTFLGFTFWMRSRVLKTDNVGAKKEWSAANVATDCAAGIAWHRGSVSRALGLVKFFDNVDDPTYFGDVISFLARAGGAPRRYDKKGVVLIHQAPSV